MISHVAVVSGYAAKLSALNGNTFSFSKGVNILFGPNGCGKTSLLNIIAGYCGCRDGGWSKRFGSKISLNAPKNLPGDIQVDGCKANVEWDGSPSFYNNTAVSDAPIAYFGQTDMEFEEEVAEVVGKLSDGQKRLKRINKVIEDILKVKAPDLTKVGNNPTKSAEAFAKYVSDLPRNGPKTLLLDEPDRSFSIENQALFWAGLQNLEKHGWQVIAATHSLFPVIRAYGEINMVDMESGYLEHSKKMLDLYVAGQAKDLFASAKKLREEKK